MTGVTPPWENSLPESSTPCQLVLPLSFLTPCSPSPFSEQKVNSWHLWVSDAFLLLFRSKFKRHLIKIAFLYVSHPIRCLQVNSIQRCGLKAPRWWLCFVSQGELREGWARWHARVMCALSAKGSSLYHKNFLLRHDFGSRTCREGHQQVWLAQRK